MTISHERRKARIRKYRRLLRDKKVTWQRELGHRNNIYLKIFLESL